MKSSEEELDFDTITAEAGGLARSGLASTPICDEPRRRTLESTLLLLAGIDTAPGFCDAAFGIVLFDAEC